MPFQVLGGPTKDEEFQGYVEVLAGLGLPTVRDENGRVGVVDDRATADSILKNLQQRVSYLDWRIVDLS